MLKYSKYSRVFFETPETRGAASPTASTTGTGKEVATLQAPEDPFKDIELDNLDETTRAAIQKAQSTITTVHQERVAATQTAERNERLARQFQSSADTLASRLREAQPKTEKEDPYEKETIEFLKSKGFTDEQIKGQGPVLAGLVKVLVEKVVKPSIGHDLGPMQGAVVHQQATNEFLNAQRLDDVGVLAIPAVAQEVWDIVQGQAGQGTAMSAEAIVNLAKMRSVDHFAKNGWPGTVPPPGGGTAPAVTPTPTPTPTPVLVPRFNSGGLTYPGATAAPVYPAATPTGGTPPINADTQAALASTFEALARATGGVKPQAFGGKRK